MLRYLETYHKDDIAHIVNATSKHETSFRALPVDLSVLKANNLQLFKQVTYRINVWTERPKWTSALNEAQAKHINDNRSSMVESKMLKEDFPVTFVNLPDIPKNFRPYEQLWNLVQVKGNVYRTKERGKMEVTREYKCRKCKKTTILKADRFTEFHFEIPDKCNISRECKGTMFDTEEPNRDDANLLHVIEYQEIKIQLSDRPNSVSQWLLVELDEELVESCFIGDRVTLCGTLETRSVKKVNEHRLVMRAVSVIVQDNQQKLNIDMTELRLNVKMDWLMDLEKFGGDELKLRDEMVCAVAPEVEGLAMVKFGLLLVLCTGGRTNAHGGNTQVYQKSSTTREISHLLMVGDPGLGKSQILKAASEISTNAVRTVGYAATTAGLTANCFVEGGETHIEAGALVKANNGICCLDELNFMSKEHRGSIHEVMEHQKISMAKAGLRVELHTKCSIIAGMNQKNSSEVIEAKNISIEQSLLSRFDIVFELEDAKDPDLDNIVISHILDGVEQKNETSWNHERLQMHIQVAKEIRVEMTKDASEILKHYFLFCKNHEEIEPSRRTMRMWNSLERLTISHAKLMLRENAGIEDAVSVIVLMESTWSFGHLLASPSVMWSKVPLGPTRDVIADVLDKLDLNELLEKKIIATSAVVEDKPCDKTIVDEMFVDEEELNFDTEEISEKLSAEEISSSQAINSPKLQTETSFTLASFKSPQSSSTQLDSSKPLAKKTEFFTSPTSQTTKSEATKQPELDPLYMKLNSLAAFYTDKTAAEVSTTSAVSSKTPSPSNSLSKLKKFQYKADSQSEQSNSENLSGNPQNSLPKVLTMKSIEDIDVDGEDLFAFD